MKTCTSCHLSKPLSDFNKQPSTKDGLSYYCKECKKTLNHKRYLKKSAYLIAQIKAWQAEHPEALKEYKARYNLKH